MVVALALSFGAMILGAGAGLLCARRGWPWWLGAVVMVLGAGLGFAVAVVTWVTVWDGAWVGALVGIGWMLGALVSQGRRAQVGFAVMSVVGVLGAGEIAARSGGPMPAGVVDTRLTLPKFDPATRDFSGLSADLSRSLLACGLAFPTELSRWVENRLPSRDDRRPVTLVLGDSMSAGLDPSPVGTWPDQLQRLQPSTELVSAALVGASIDLHWAVLRSWRRLLGARLQRVIVQLFVNDPMELGRPWDCCNGRPMIDFSGGRARLVCDRPRWVAGGVVSWRWRVHVSPLPLVVRVAAPYSMLALKLVLAHYSWQTRLPSETEEASRTKLSLALRGMAGDARGLEVVALVVPWRPVLDPRSPQHGHALQQHRALISAARAVGWAVIDPLDALRARAREISEERLFLPNGEHHFSREGYAVIARWVAHELDTRQNP